MVLEVFPACCGADGAGFRSTLAFAAPAARESTEQQLNPNRPSARSEVLSAVSGPQVQASRGSVSRSLTNKPKPLAHMLRGDDR
jgi:hypothetical protein